MPRLSAFQDNDELDNAISDKLIVYVEGPDDVAFFKALAGPNINDRLEFKTPEGGTGYHEVKSRVGALRPRNRKVHGLLDGEAAVALGEIQAFLESDRPIFGTENEDLDGIIFLSEYELENLLICHAKLARFITNNVPVAQLGTRDLQDVQNTLDAFARRFYLYSLVKFTMVTLHNPERPCKGAAKIGGHFLDETASSATLMRSYVRQEIEGQVAWDEFQTALRALSDRFRARRALIEEPLRQRETLRVADGKLMLKHVKKRYGGDSRWDGHLHNELVQSDYSDTFRQALLGAVSPGPDAQLA